MTDLHSLYEKHKDLSEDDQKKIAQAFVGDMGQTHTQFVKTIAAMVQSGEINVFAPESFYKPGAYESLDEQSRGQADVAMVNIADSLRHIADFYISKKTPDASPQLEQMIEHLWQMKERLEKKFGDILKF